MKNNANSWINNITITKHFISRYNERILNRDINEDICFEDLKNEVCQDMKERLTDREKTCVQLLIQNEGTIKIPLDGINQLIMLDKKLITVY